MHINEVQGSLNFYRHISLCSHLPDQNPEHFLPQQAPSCLFSDPTFSKYNYVLISSAMHLTSFTCFWTSYKLDHTAYTSSCLTSFVQHYVCEIQTCWCVSIVCCFSGVVFYCMNSNYAFNNKSFLIFFLKKQSLLNLQHYFVIDVFGFIIFFPCPKWVANT